MIGRSTISHSNPLLAQYDVTNRPRSLVSATQSTYVATPAVVAALHHDAMQQPSNLRCFGHPCSIQFAVDKTRKRPRRVETPFRASRVSSLRGEGSRVAVHSCSTSLYRGSILSNTPVPLPLLHLATATATATAAVFHLAQSMVALPMPPPLPCSSSLPWEGTRARRESLPICGGPHDDGTVLGTRPNRSEPRQPSAPTITAIPLSSSSRGLDIRKMTHHVNYCLPP
eukprot:TRINITY_DN6506_c0_g1_i1.p1 TRINITY_DN6506_c0_g1~~TRINITY_DN6506_c0_g1_i1.p1  ORF type:complete len:227 (-),score=20.68 TRINITY_DN6506_c0_g1_i1:339-1019(-)